MSQPENIENWGYIEPDVYEEYKPISDFASWVILILFSAFVLGSAMFVHMILPDRERQWEYGALSDVPGQSIYSTQVPKVAPIAPLDQDKVPTQLVTPVPGAKPFEKQDPAGYQRKGRR